MEKNGTYYCSGCKKDIEKKVYDYSMKEFGKVLCKGCQKNPKPQANQNPIKKRD